MTTTRTTPWSATRRPVVRARASRRLRRPGAAALTRDYFRQGFYPSGQQNDADSRELGAAALKALLVTSADFMSGANLTRAHRWNNEQGYGRIQLSNALPLQSSPRSPLGALLNDPFGGGVSDLGLPFTISHWAVLFDDVRCHQRRRASAAGDCLAGPDELPGYVTTST